MPDRAISTSENRAAGELGGPAARPHCGFHAGFFDEDRYPVGFTLRRAAHHALAQSVELIER